MFIFLAVLCAFAIVGIYVWRNMHAAKVEGKVMAATQSKNARTGEPEYTPEQIQQFKEASKFPLPGLVTAGLAMLFVVFIGLGTFHKIFFYAEPGYVYHVRTILGEERVVNNVGYSYYLFGRKNAWKKAMTVQATPRGAAAHTEGISAEGDEGNTSANLGPQNVIFLDQVDADVTATARFEIPTDPDTFLRLAHQYRSPSNLLRTSLIPTFRETLQATGSLMSAEEYFSGSRTEFNREFEDQLQNGIYIVRREEVVVRDPAAQARGSANATKGVEQDNFDDDTKVVFKVQKQYDATGIALRKTQHFVEYGISLVEAKVTDVQPNQKFVERMSLKQEASANRAIAREQRIQEEQQKLLAIAKGEREVAEKQAEAKKEQITKTTNAETDKQLTLTNATRQKEQAQIDKERSEILLEKARIDAEAVQVKADAEAYKKRAIIEADNALAQKLETEERIQKAWADAFARRNVPGQVWISGSGGDGSDTPAGSNGETALFMKAMTAFMADRLSYDRGIPLVTAPPAQAR